VPRILDLGCGRQGSKLTDTLVGTPVGVDLSLSELRAAKRNLADYLLVCARAEELPFKDGCFSQVISGVALPYMDIRRVVGEVARVLQPGGRFIASLHPLSFTLSELKRSVLTLYWRDIGYRVYVIVNGILLHCLGVGFRFPFGSKRFESFQTYHSISRALRRAGLRKVEMYVAARSNHPG
jgi:ubiquinone/menaquinone biosynthesis C-methylase UbiE